MKAIFWKEVRSYFYSPMAYILIGLFTMLTSIFFYPNLLYSNGDFNGVLSTMSFILLFIVPVLTMRILAEDRKNGTEVLLITSPIDINSIVLGKFFAAYFVFLIMTALTFIYPVILLIFGGHFTFPLLTAYLGFLLLGASFVAVGIFASSLTENQVIAVIIGFVLLLVLWLAGTLAQMAGGTVGKVLNFVSLLSRYDDFNRGILGLSPIIYYLSFTTIFLFLTTRVIERRRWSQG